MTKQRVQYNGMMLLASYVQRLHVYYATLQHMEGNSFPQVEKAKDAFESINAIMPMFEQTRVLTASQLEKLEKVATDVDEMMGSYFSVIQQSFSYRVSIVASTLFSEQLMNAGVIRLGKLFNEIISPDFERRVKFYEDRTKMIQYVVGMTKEGKEVPEEILKVVEELYAAIEKQQQVIISDVQKIIPMLNGNQQ